MRHEYEAHTSTMTSKVVKMADESEIFIDGKPLSSLRVVDLKEELKKRGVKSSGNKNLLKDLLKLVC